MSLQGHSAPGPAAAFGYQFERAFLWLAKSPSGARIGIETCDDVSSIKGDGSLALEQDKHSVRPNGTPYADRSRDLWNTLAIWVTALAQKEIEAENTAFFLVTNKLLPDCIAKRMSAACTPTAVEACIGELRKAADNPPEGIRRFCDQVLNPQRGKFLENLILKIEVVDGSGGKALRDETIAHLPIPESYRFSAEGIANELLGWMHTEALLAWQAQKPAWISRDHFINRIHAALDQRKRAVQRERAENLLPVLDEDVGRELGRPFVRQLHLITDDGSVVDGSIKDFLRCNTEKMRLSREGNITDADWRAFESSLTRRWNSIQSRVRRNSAAKNLKISVGRSLLTQ